MSTNSPDTLSREVATAGDREAALPAEQPAGLKTLDSHVRIKSSSPTGNTPTGSG